MNYTYILKCKDETLYTGWTNDIEKRLEAHNAGKGAKYTRSRRPVELVYLEQFETKEEAMRREYAIKHMTRRVGRDFWIFRGCKVYNKEYITTKWQALPPITKRWKISWLPKFLCLVLKIGSFSA